MMDTISTYKNMAARRSDALFSLVGSVTFSQGSDKVIKMIEHDDWILIHQVVRLLLRMKQMVLPYIQSVFGETLC